jgi:Protein of unknown function (DUF429)
MFYTNTTYIGIDPTAGVRPFTYVALDHERNILALGRGDMEDILAFVAGQRSALVAVCAPRSPNRGLMDRQEVRQNLNPLPRPGRWRNFRVAEYQLRQHNIPIPQTPADPEDSPGWMQKGFTLFHRLGDLHYLPYPEENADRQSLEIYPHACFAALLGRLPFPKHTLEGRLQRQLALYDCQLKVADPMLVFEEITRHRLLQGILPMEALYHTEELDAMAAAYTAWVAGTKPEEITRLGDPEEGYLVLPVPELKERYS